MNHAPHFVDRPGTTAAQGASRDTPEERPCGSSSHIPVLRRSREAPCASIMPGLLCLAAGVPGATPSTAFAPGAVYEVKRESAYKPGSVESSHSSAMRVAAHL